MKSRKQRTRAQKRRERAKKETAGDEFYEPLPIKPYTDLNFIDEYVSLKIERDFADYFAQASESTIPSRDAEVIKNAYLLPEEGTATSQSAEIRLHDREFETNERRNYPEYLTPEQLRQALALKRFGEEGLPDASRRQISISNMTPTIIRILAETAAIHQVDSLRDALAKYLSGDASISALKEVYGPDIPRLELHLPYLAMRRRMPDCSSGLQSGFIVPDFAVPARELHGSYIIHKAHISIVLCLWDHSKWTAFEFSKPCPEDQCQGPEDEDDMSSTENDPEEHEPAPLEDILCPDNGVQNSSEQGIIWNPRVYYLRIMALWLDAVQREYTYLVRTLGAGAGAWRTDAWSDVPAALCETKPDNGARIPLETTIKMIQLLGEVRRHISLATKAWKFFQENDMAYFADLNDRIASGARVSSCRSVTKLAKLEQDLGALVDDLTGTANLLSLQLNLESNELSHNAHRLIEHTNLISRDNHELNRRSTCAAVANVKAAEKTSWTTTVSVLLLWITAPVTLVLQYFGSEQAIFSFDRNPRTFGIAIVIVFSILPLLLFALYSIQRMQKAFWESIVVRKMKQSHHEDESGAVELDVFQSAPLGAA